MKLLEFVFVSEANAQAAQSQAEVPAASETKKEKRELPWYIEIPLVVVITIVVIAIFQAFVGRIYMIPSQSMEPTLHGCEGCTGDRIYVNKLAYTFGEPAAGDVVVFKAPESWETGMTNVSNQGNIFSRGLSSLGSMLGITAGDEVDMVKRIIATGGQTVRCIPGDEGITVDGEVIDDSYVLDPPARNVIGEGGSEACGGAYFGPITVPEGNYFMMGDNRTNSADSRYHIGDEFEGTVPADNIVGKVEFIFFPFDRIGGVESYDLAA